MVFLSKRSVEKIGSVQREFRRAMDRSKEMPEGYIHTIPVKLDSCTIPPQFSRHQWANLDEDGAFDRIVHALHFGLEQRGRPVPVPAPPPEAAPKQNTPVRVIETPFVPQASTATAMPETMTNDLDMTFVRIPAGEFWMGSSAEQIEALLERYSDLPREWLEKETPQHQVTISQPFDLSIHPVTQAQWEAVMDLNPSRFKGMPKYPVGSVSWDDVQDFLYRLNARGDGHIYALPSEAQWEYACRAGSSDAYSFGDDKAQLGDYAWYSANAGKTTHPVGQKQANTWGLYDMHGNVWEWCQDWYDPYAAQPVADPSGPANGVYRILRGGSWLFDCLFARSASRRAFDPGDRNDFAGFRVARGQAASPRSR